MQDRKSSLPRTTENSYRSCSQKNTAKDGDNQFSIKFFVFVGALFYYGLFCFLFLFLSLLQNNCQNKRK